MSDTSDHIPDDDLLAAEFVLGVLSSREMQAAEQRAARDPDFAALVSAWQARLTPWTDEIAPIAPSETVWQRIEATLPAHPLRRASDRAPSAPWWNALAFWRGLAFGTGGLAIASLVALFVILAKPAQPPLVAALEAGGQRAAIVTLDRERGSLVIVPASLSIPQGRVPELWLIPPGEKPRSLGLINPERAVTIAIPASLLAAATPQAALAVSEEPPGGSPTGQPTGKVVAVGKLTNL
ncbi:MAG TPA: anti-sigma factor [Pseudolabrys sp.]|nr:anti-sigma factor [Pseudolabrys sp.]